MAKPRRRPSSDPVDSPIPIELLSAPFEGSCTVLCLSDYSGILTRYVRKERRSYACPGLKLCKEHDACRIWKAYASAQLWREAPHNDWRIVVLEITERLAEQFGSEPIRGQVWELFRRPGRYGRIEVAGKLLEQRDPKELRADVRFEPFVHRLYRSEHIKWGVDPLFAEMASFAPSKDAPPPAAEIGGVKPQERPATREDVARLRGTIPMPSGNGNGQHAKKGAE